MNEPNYYAIIPANVRYDPGLKASEKLLYGEISALSQKDGYCFAGNRYFAELYGVALATVSRWVSHLQENGYVKVDLVTAESGEIEMRRIAIIPESMRDRPHERSIPSCEKDQYPHDEKIKYNNTRVNNNTPLPPKGDEMFERFWNAYPKRRGKEPARKAFYKLKPSEVLLSTIISAIEADEQTDQWRRDGGQYIPYPATWLNQRRWEDERTVDLPPDGPAYLDEYL